MLPQPVLKVVDEYVSYKSTISMTDVDSSTHDLARRNAHKL